MKERLQELLRLKGLSPKKLAELIDVQPSAISHIISGRNKPGFDFLSKLLLAFPDINPTWLIVGVGDAYLENRGPLGLSTTVSGTNIDAPSSETIAPTVSANIFEDLILNDTPGIPPEQNGRSVMSPDVKINQQMSILRDDIEQIVVFYKDGTFSPYKPKK